MKPKAFVLTASLLFCGFEVFFEKKIFSQKFCEHRYEKNTAQMVWIDIGHGCDVLKISHSVAPHLAKMCEKSVKSQKKSMPTCV